MPVIETEQLLPNGTYQGRRLTSNENLQVYNGLDCCLTTEIFEEISGLTSVPPAIYSFERALQGPYLEIMQRGFLVDELSRRQAAAELRIRVDSLQLMLDEFAHAVWNKGLNPRSPQQLKDFFFRAMNLPEIWQSKKGQKKLSTDREALEKLHDYIYARPFVNCILAIRDFTKQLNVFESEIDHDGRYRTSYNIAGTETGRPSSSTNAYGTGGNAQNISGALRFVFVADPGMRMCLSKAVIIRDCVHQMCLAESVLLRDCNY